MSEVLDKELIAQAEAGDVDAIRLIGELYQLGEGVECDPAKARTYFAKAADQGDLDSKYFLAELYASGKGGPADYGVAESLYKEVIASHWDFFYLAVEGLSQLYTYKLKDHDKNFQLWKELAETGHTKAEFRLGIMYQDGVGTTKDLRQAVYWWKKAAEKGNDEALRQMGVVYRDGIVVACDPKKAVACFEKAAEQGNVSAMCCLADMYGGNRGISQDYQRAEAYADAAYRELVKHSEEVAPSFYDDILLALAKLYSEKLDDSRKAFSLWGEAAQRGNINAQVVLGACYADGRGTEKSKERALYWWKKAAAQGDEDAKQFIAELSFQDSISTSSGGCYVATAIYGSYDCPQVWTLRRYRDYTLAKSWHGRAFIRAYYAVSPTLVRWFGNTQWFKNFWKPILDHTVENLRENGVEDTSYSDRSW